MNKVEHITKHIKCTTRSGTRAASTSSSASPVDETSTVAVVEPVTDGNLPGGEVTSEESPTSTEASTSSAQEDTSSAVPVEEVTTTGETGLLTTTPNTTCKSLM